MKMSLAALTISACLAWLCCAQDSGPSAPKPNAPVSAAPVIPNADQVAYYKSLNQRVFEFRAQFDLLSQLAQEHRTRADGTPTDQIAKTQWERELAKELSDKASVTLALRNNLSKEREAFEQTHPDLVASYRAYFLAGGYNADEIAFMGKLDERLAAVQQEIAETIENGKLYTVQLLTNTGADNVQRISFLLQENGTAVKRLQKEAWDLELKQLEFHALRRN
jgi:hypothetical protein